MKSILDQTKMLLTVIKTLFLAQKNVGDSLALTISVFLKSLQTCCYQRLDNKKKQNDLGHWQEPPEDIKEMIVQHMSFSGRVCLSSLCKSWRLVSMRRDIRAPRQLPWLVHPQLPNCHTYLSFSSLSEGKVFKLRLPKPVFMKSRLARLVPRCFHLQWFICSSKGWLILWKWDYVGLKREMFIFLLNPVSRAQHQLPSLKTIPSYGKHSTIDRFVLSSPDISECMVAAVHNSGELALCRPRDKSWSVYQVFEENENLVERVNCILFSSTGVLYALVTGSRNGGGVDTDRTLKFGDDEVKLKLIYDIEEWWIDAGVSPVGLLGMSYLLESTNNEILLIHQIQRMDVDEDDEEFMEGHEDNEEGNNNEEEEAEEEEGDDNNMEDNEEHESILEWAGQILLSVYAKAKQLNPDFNIDKEDPETICFRVYKIDPDNNYYHKVENLGDQIFFVAEDGSSLSLLASDFKELQGNCIYFATTGCNIETSCISCEVGIFYMDSGKIEQPFPIVKMPRYSHLSWFAPSLW